MPTSLLGVRNGDMLDIVVHTTAQVRNTSTLIVAENKSRRYLLIVNDSNNLIYISHSVPAQLHAGIRLEPNGGKFECALSGSNLCCHPIYGIQDNTNPKLVLVSEGM